MKVIFKRILGEVCSAIGKLSTVQGSHNLSGSRRWRFFLWVCFFVGNFAFTAYLVAVVDERFERKQIYTQISSLRVDSVPFPSVIICNENAVSRRQVANIDSILKANGISIERREEFLSRLPTLTLRTLKIADGVRQGFSDLFKILYSHYYDVDDIMFEVHQRCENLLVHCTFNREVKACKEIFNLVKTFMGYCCAFNYGGVGDRSSFHSSSNEDSVGKAGFISTSESGRFSGLRVVFNVDPEDYPRWSKARFYGVKILISDPNDYPETTVHARYLAAGQNMAIKLYPFVYVSDQQLKRFRPTERNCRFEDELKLASTSRYSFETCCTECRMEMYSRICGCLPYYYPSDELIKYCELSDLGCLRNATVLDDMVKKPEMQYGCECLPECSDKLYRVRSDVSPNLQFMLPDSVVMNDSLSTLSVYYKRPTCTLYKKVLLMDWYDLIATHGGVFSLSVGASMVTVAEITQIILQGLCKMKLKQKTAIKKRLKEYCTHSSMHGFRYLMEDQSHWSKKIIWGMILALSFTFCCIWSHILMNKYGKTPTVTVVETTNHPTTNVDFPAVTVCPQNFVYEPNTVNITEILKRRGYGNTEINIFYEMISLEKIYQNSLPNSIVQIFQVLDKVGYSMKRIIETLAQPCEKLVLRCWWRWQEVPCRHAFRRRLLHTGHCCRFDIQYLRENMKNETIILPAGFDKFRGLSVEIDSGQIRRNGKLVPSTVMVFVGGPERDVTLNDDAELVMPGTEVNIAIEPSVVESSADVKALPLDTRQCLLKENFTLDVLGDNKSPSYGGCIADGFHRSLLAACYCTLFYMKEADDGITWDKYQDCTIKDNLCLSEFGVGDFTSKLANVSAEYNCYSACDEVEYEYSVDYVQKDLVFSKQDQVSPSSQLNVFLLGRTCLKYRRELLFSWDQLLASLGGIFGLCLGGSIVSVVEILTLLVDIIAVNFSNKIRRTNAVNFFPKNDNVYVVRRSDKIKSTYPINEFIGKK